MSVRPSDETCNFSWKTYKVLPTLVRIFHSFYTDCLSVLFYSKDTGGYSYLKCIWLFDY